MIVVVAVSMSGGCDEFDAVIAVFDDDDDKLMRCAADGLLDADALAEL